MKTKCVRLHGKMDLRLEEIELPEIKEDEVLAKVVSDSLCMSSYKAAKQGADHKRVPNDVAEHPTIVGHEFCGTIVEVGDKWKHKFKPGQGFAIQPAHNYHGSLDAPGYSYQYCGGDSQYVIIPRETLEMDCLLPYNGDAYFYGSLSEPMSCIVGAFHASYHTTPGKYVHDMGIVEGGCMAILAGAGPMGMGAIDYAIHNSRKPKLLIVTDIDDGRLNRAASLLTVEDAAKNGVELKYINTAKMENADEELLKLTGGQGFQDIFVFAPVKPVVEQADKLLAQDGCLNFFAGPTDKQFSAKMNFYDVHYNSTHVMGTTGGNTADMIESLELTAAKRIDPAVMVTHIGGLNAAAETTLNLPKIPGGKKLIYTHLTMPLIALTDLRAKGEQDNDPRYTALADIVDAHNGLWCPEAEEYLLANFNPED